MSENKINVDRIVDDIVDNFKDITGYDIADVFNKNMNEPVFNQDVISKSIDSIKEYVLDNYDIDIIANEDILYALDAKLAEMHNRAVDDAESDSEDLDFVVNEKVLNNYTKHEYNINESASREFIELPEFRKLWAKLNLTDEDLRELQSLIIDGHSAIPLGSNVYKIRYSSKKLNKGKDTSNRVIYIDFIIDSKVYLITVFSKSDEANITNTELDSIRNLFKELENI